MEIPEEDTEILTVVYTYSVRFEASMACTHPIFSKSDTQHHLCNIKAEPFLTLKA